MEAKLLMALQKEDIKREKYISPWQIKESGAMMKLLILW